MDAEYRSRLQGSVAHPHSLKPDPGHGPHFTEGVETRKGDQYAALRKGRVRGTGSIHHEDAGYGFKVKGRKLRNVQEPSSPGTGEKDLPSLEDVA